MAEIYSAIMSAISDVNLPAVENATTTLTGIMQDVHALDTAIAESIPQDSEIALSTQDLLQQRDVILRRLHLSNRNLANKAENIQSLIRYDIAGMANNRNALKGYRPMETEKKNIIRSSF